MCFGELARALGIKMTTARTRFSPPPSSIGTSNSSINIDHHASMASARLPLMMPPTTQTQQQDDGLPKAFVASLRVLFNILDEDKDGFVPFAEIKERWDSDEGPSGLPANVIECLSKVAPKSGKLSFERFCSGLRLALGNGKSLSPERRSPNRSDRQPTTATVRPNVVHPMRSFKSAPQLRDEKKRRSLSENDSKKNPIYGHHKTPTSKPGKKPQRYSTGNYETYYARPVNNGDVSSDTSYEDQKIYEKHRKLFQSDNRKKNHESDTDREDVFDDRRRKMNGDQKSRKKTYGDHETIYEGHKEKIYEYRDNKSEDRGKETVYEDRNKVYESRGKEKIYEDRNKVYESRNKEKIYKDRNKVINESPTKEKIYEDWTKVYERRGREKSNEDPNKVYERRGKEKIYEDRNKAYESRGKERIYEDQEEKIHSSHKDKIYDQRADNIRDDDDPTKSNGNQQNGTCKDHKEIIYEDRKRNVHEEHRARLNGIRLTVQNRRSPKGDEKEKEEDPGSRPVRKDVPPNPYSHTDYMDYADLYHSPISPGKDTKDKGSRSRTMSPAGPSSTRTLSPAEASSARTLSPAARPTSPTRPVSPTTSSFSRPVSLASRSLSPASRRMPSPASQQMGERERRRRSGSRERKGGRQLHFESSPVENGHVEKMVPQPGRLRGRSPERTAVYNTNHNSNHVATNRPAASGGLRVSDPSVSMAMTNKRVQRRPRDDTRRHTSNGISVDYNLLKRMKQLEQERDVLIQGMEVVERARNWYQRQLTDVKDKQRSVHSGQFIRGEDPNSQSHQDRMAFQSLRIMEVNRQLAALVESSENSFPDHINLAMQGRRSIYLPVDTPISAQLRDQNRLLTKEVCSKSDRITKLEQEKTALIRQLFDVRAKSQREREVAEPTETSIFL